MIGTEVAEDLRKILLIFQLKGNTVNCQYIVFQGLFRKGLLGMLSVRGDNDEIASLDGGKCLITEYKFSFPSMI